MQVQRGYVQLLVSKEQRWELQSRACRQPSARCPTSMLHDTLACFALWLMQSLRVQVQRGYVQLLASKEQRWEAAIESLQTAISTLSNFHAALASMPRAAALQYTTSWFDQLSDDVSPACCHSALPQVLKVSAHLALQGDAAVAIVCCGA